jgi:hypothetical protein
MLIMPAFMQAQWPSFITPLDDYEIVWPSRNFLQILTQWTSMKIRMRLPIEIVLFFQNVMKQHLPKITFRPTCLSLASIQTYGNYSHVVKTRLGME